MHAQDRHLLLVRFSLSKDNARVDRSSSVTLYTEQVLLQDWFEFHQGPELIIKVRGICVAEEITPTFRLRSAKA